MSHSTLGRKIWRRWYVLAVVCLAFVAAGAMMMQSGGTYYSKTAVWFSLDAPPTMMPDSGADTPNIIAFAGAIATQLNNGRAPTNYSSPDAPYYGAGVRQGILVGVRDVGGQWANWFSRAVIDLQIVGPTEQWVADQQDGLMDRIQQAVEMRTTTADGTDFDVVDVQVEQFTQGVEYIAPSRVMQAAAFAALALAALLVGGWAAVTADLAVQRFTRRRGRLGPRNDAMSETEMKSEMSRT